MEALKNLKQLQCLNGSIAALNRFVSGSIDKFMPFFKTLHKKSLFEWSDYCHEAFNQLKAYISSVPLLPKLMPGDKLLLYLAMSISVVSSTLVKQDHSHQIPIYFTSKVMTNAKTKYPPIKKSTLAFVIATWCLRPYFQAHLVTGFLLLAPDAMHFEYIWRFE